MYERELRLRINEDRLAAPAAQTCLKVMTLPRILLQILVDESDCHAALTDCGRNAFHLAQPHIATGENPGST